MINPAVSVIVFIFIPRQNAAGSRLQSHNPIRETAVVLWMGRPGLWVGGGNRDREVADDLDDAVDGQAMALGRR